MLELWKYRNNETMTEEELHAAKAALIAIEKFKKNEAMSAEQVAVVNKYFFAFLSMGKAKVEQVWDTKNNTPWETCVTYNEVYGSAVDLFVTDKK